jgi:hypothetical protein
MTTDNSNNRYLSGNGWRGGHAKMTFRNKMLFINVQLIPNTEIFSTKLQMELTFTTHRLFIWRRSVREHSSVSSLSLHTQ